MEDRNDPLAGQAQGFPETARLSLASPLIGSAQTSVGTTRPDQNFTRPMESTQNKPCPRGVENGYFSGYNAGR